MKFKGVIFDLDGTLLDTIDDLADTMNQVLEGYGHLTHTVDKYKYFVGDGMNNLVRRALPQEITSESLIEEAFQRMKEHYSLNWVNKSKPYPGISELLDFLQENNIKIAVLSNKAHNFTVEMVEKLLPKWKFSVVYGERDGIPRKPDPAGALEIANIWGITPENILYLGDTNTDMKTAVNSSMYPVGVLWGFREKDELILHGAKTVIANPMELLQLL